VNNVHILPCAISAICATGMAHIAEP
jgi:hypothetical protein